MQRLTFTFLIFVAVVIFSATNIIGQSGQGKLAGTISDAETGEPLIGANLIILGTSMGAATDIDGKYFILNIPPATYEVKISYVGYSSKTVQNVRLVAGITYELNEVLTSGINLEEIVITDQKFFEEKSTNTVKVIDSDQISKLPVRGVSNIASLQSGVVVAEGSGGSEGNAEINVRGGRGSEVLYIVDGVPQNNLYNRANVAQVSNAAIEQISFQVGGFEAKYGQSQSGIVNVTTKSGSPKYNVFADVVSSTFTDDYGYNEYTVTLGGPIIPGVSEHTIFLSGERGWFKDADPSAIEMDFRSINKTLESYDNNPASVWRFSGRTNHQFGDFSVRLGALVNMRTYKQLRTTSDRLTAIRMMKQNSRFLEESTQENSSFSAKISQTVSNTTFWNLNLGYRLFDFELYNPFFNDDLEAYGDSTRWQNELDITLLGDGRRVNDVDENGIFRPYGWNYGLYQHREDDAFSADIDFTSQVANHLFEFGGGISYHLVRGYGIFAYQIAGQSDDLTLVEKFENQQPFVYGYDVTGRTKTGVGLDTGDPLNDRFLAPRNPLLGYAYIQDRYELEDIVLNIGVRLDYFDIKSNELINPDLPYAGGSDPFEFDDGDFKTKDVEVEISPRLGIGFPVTETTVFHAQYGRFIQIPELNDLYAGPFSYSDWVVMEPQFGQNGGLLSEETTQYEIGFRQLLGDNAALNMTAFYKNIQNLVNDQNHHFQRVADGELVNSIYSTNADFGTTKGFALSFDVTKLSYFNVSAQYTFSIAEGTGSSTSSSHTSVFRNQDRQAPKVIAPLDFDQRHTGVINLDFFIPKGELGYLEMLSANFILSFNSGRPYTPVDFYNPLTANNGGPSTTGYINSRYGPSTFRIDMRLEKSFDIDNLRLSPYIWIENLLDAINVTDVWRSTGDAYTTGWLLTEEGQAVAENQGEGYVQDYQTLEKDPRNFGVPRQIRLGMRIDFSNFSF